MEAQKPIIATTLSGLFIKTEPWKNAHHIWFEQAAKKLKDSSITDWQDKPDYFQGVDTVMKRLYPELSDKQRTQKARELFFDAVCAYMKKKNMRNEQVIAYFKKLKTKYTLALITTNTSTALKKILSINNLENFFDVIESSTEEEKDDKTIVFQRFLKKYGKPLVYIGGERKDTYEFCTQNNISCVFANFENTEDLSNVKIAHSLEELKSFLNQV